MSLESVRAFLSEKAPDIEVVELERSSETNSLAAGWGVKPAQIAKALALKVGERNILLMACGDSRLDNKKIKNVLGGKAKMLPPEETAALTGHPVGGVCPFGLATPIPIYCDTQLKRFDLAVTGGGSTHSAIRINPLRMAGSCGSGVDRRLRITKLTRTRWPPRRKRRASSRGSLLTLGTSFCI